MWHAPKSPIAFYSLRRSLGRPSPLLQMCEGPGPQEWVPAVTADLVKLKNKCKDLDAKSWHNSIQIICVPEGPNSSTILQNRCAA